MTVKRRVLPGARENIPVLHVFALVLTLATLFYPEGVPVQNIVSGVYPGGDAGGCCWMGASASIRLEAPAGADTAVVTIEIPPYAAVPGGTSIATSFDGVPAQTACCFGTGVAQAAFRIPGDATHFRTLVMRIVPSSHFVPARLHLDKDTRTLSVLLRGITVEDVASGARYGVAANPTVQDRSVSFADLLLLLAAAVVTLVLVRRRIAYAWVLLIASDPFALALPVGGTTITLPKVVLVAAIVALAAQHVSARPLRDRRFLALAGVFLIFIVSMTLSSLHAFSHAAALRETLKAVGYLVTLAVAALAYHDDPDRDLLRRTLAYVTIVVAAVAIPEMRYGSAQSIAIAGHTFARVAGPLEGPNQLGAFLGITLPVLLSLAIGERVRLEDVAAFALGGAALALTFSRAGVVACVAACVLVVLLRLRQRGVVLAIVAVLWIALGALALASAPNGGGLFDRIFPARVTDAYNGGLGTRPALWRGAVTMWRQHPVLGVGPGNYELQISSFAPGVRTHANNYYLQALSEQGALGLAALVLLVVATVWLLYGRPDALRVGVLAVVIAFGFHQIVDGLLIYPKVGDVYWTLVGIAL